MHERSILQVLTLLGKGGSYGGPLRVAFELAEELISRGHKVKILGGAVTDQSFPVSASVETEGMKAAPISARFRVSSLYGFRIPFRIFSNIKKYEIVHIHYGRDLIPISTAFLCMAIRKPFFLQTHGMIRRDDRLLVKLIDFVSTKYIFRKANAVFALQSEERQELMALGFPAKIELLPNGIRVNVKSRDYLATEPFTAVFCARLAPVKQIHKFLQIALLASKEGLQANFEIYGPDGGDLTAAIDFILSNRLSDTVSYKGEISPADVPTVLSTKSLLILPSRYDPFPVSTLEALSVGTPVIVNPSCGISDLLKSFDPSFVSKNDEISSLYEVFLFHYLNPISPTRRIEIQNYTEVTFSIQRVVNEIIELYEKTL